MTTVGRISYTNTEPFFFDWPAGEFELLNGVPRELARQARAGRVDAAPLPIVECWDLENDFEPLGNWGIAAAQECWSVLALSNKPLNEYKALNVGVTTDSSTSVALLEILCRMKYGQEVALRRGFHDSDDARLIIGDQALQIWDRPERAGFDVVTDLATEWWQWRKLPFVFAQWVVRKSTDERTKASLGARLAKSLAAGRANLDVIAERKSGELSVPAKKIKDYLSVIYFELGEKERKAVGLFRDMHAELKTGAAR